MPKIGVAVFCVFLCIVVFSESALGEWGRRRGRSHGYKPGRNTVSPTGQRIKVWRKRYREIRDAIPLPTWKAAPLKFSGGKVADERVTAEDIALIQAIKEVGGKSVNAVLDPVVCKETAAYANMMAKFRSQNIPPGGGEQAGHFEAESRYRIVSGGHVSGSNEITSESFADSGRKDGFLGHARSCVSGYLASPGHKRIMMAAWKRGCIKMVCDETKSPQDARSKKGRCYCNVLLTNHSAPVPKKISSEKSTAENAKPEESKPVSEPAP